MQPYHSFPNLRIGDIEATIPVIQGGMGVGISLSRLAGAVAREGGIGVIASVGIGMGETDFADNPREANLRALEREIKKAKQESRGIIGVNVMMALTDSYEHIQTSIESGADIVFMGAGIPRRLPAHFFAAATTKMVPIVSSARVARIICDAWIKNYSRPPDAIVVEGPRAGGHLGFKHENITQQEYALEHLIKEVIEVAQSYKNFCGRVIPVIAAGGIYTGQDIRTFLSLGASGVQMGTRFVATHESDASVAFKMAYVNCTKDDIVLIESPVGMPGRAIANPFLDAVKTGEKKPFTCLWQCITQCDVINAPYCIGEAMLAAKKGDLNNGFAFCGENAYRIKKIVSVRELFEELWEEYCNE